MSGPFDIVNPRELGKPHGFNHGLVAPPGARLLFVAGQTATDEAGRITSNDFAAQFERALERVLAVVRHAGGRPEHVGRMTIYVTTISGYAASREALGVLWKRHMGSHYPAMALVEVTALFDPDALVEIEATAVLP